MRIVKGRLFICILWLAFSTHDVYGQVPVFKSLNFERYSRKSNVQCLHQDMQGYIWIGSDNGLIRYNGLDFAKHPFSDSISNAAITAMWNLDENAFLVGLSDGRVWEIRGSHWNLILQPDTIDGKYAVSSITGNSNGIYVTTYGAGVYHLYGKSFKRYYTGNILPDDYIYCSYLDSSGCLWVGSDGGLQCLKFEGEVSCTSVTTRDGLPDNIVRVIKPRKNGKLWLGLQEYGITLFNPKERSFETPEQLKSWDYGPVNSIIQLDNEIWSATPKGIVDFEFAGYKRLRLINPNNNELHDLKFQLHDMYDNVWVTDGHEVFYTPGENIEFLNFTDSLFSGNIHSILASFDGVVWFSNDKGLFSFQPFTGMGSKVISGPVKLPVKKNSKIICMYEDASGMLWIGFFDEGVVRYDPVTGLSRRFTENHGLVNNNILSITGNEDRIWFATLGGVSSCEINSSDPFAVPTFKNYTEENGLGTNFIYTVFTDKNGKVWFGTDGKGVTVYDGVKFTNFHQTSGLKSSVIYSITEDWGGNIWLNSADNGLFKFQADSFVHYSTIDGLSEPTASGIACDPNGNLVVLHNNSIDVIDPETGGVNTFGEEIGMAGIEPDLNVVSVDRDGNIWIGSRIGIVKLCLKKSAGSKSPKVVLNNALVYLSEVPGGKHEFNSSDKHWTFDFDALWYINPVAVSFQYRLIGYDSGWITTRDRLVTFPNLPSGNYEFQVRSSNNGVFEEREITSYSFIIKRPFWEQPWFLAGFMIILVTSFYQYLRLRERRMKAREDLQRERIIAQYETLKNQVNPHFLFNSFNTLITVIESNKELAVEYVNRLSDYFRTLLTYREKDVITLEEEFELLDDYVFLQKKRYGDNFKMNKDIPVAALTGNMLPPLSLQLLVENALKHNAVSKETPLTVDIIIRNDLLYVSNNVNPKISKEPSTGTGIMNITSRIKIMTGREVSVVNTNSSYTVILPLIPIK